MSKIQNQRPPILTRRHNAPIIALGRQNPTRSPVLVQRVSRARLIITDLNTLIIAPTHNTTIKRIKKQRTDKTIVFDAAVYEIAGRSMKFVHNVVVATGKNVFCVVENSTAARPRS